VAGTAETTAPPARVHLARRWADRVARRADPPPGHPPGTGTAARGTSRPAAGGTADVARCIAAAVQGTRAGTAAHRRRRRLHRGRGPRGPWAGRTVADGGRRASR